MSTEVLGVACCNRTTGKAVLASDYADYYHNYHQGQLRIVLVPILACIFGLPILVLIIICALRFRAQRARKLATKRLERPGLNPDKGPTIVINGCDSETGNLRPPHRTHQEPRKLRLLTVRFKNSSDTDEEKAEMDLELTSDFILTPEESSSTFGSPT